MLCFFSLHHSSTDRCLLLTTLFALHSFFLHQRGKKPSHLKQTFWKWRKRESVIPLEKGKLIKAPCSLFSSTELLYFWWMVKRTIAFYKLGTITVCNPLNTGIHRLIKNILLCWTKYRIPFKGGGDIKLYNILTELFVWVDEHSKCNNLRILHNLYDLIPWSGWRAYISFSLYGISKQWSIVTGYWSHPTKTATSPQRPLWNRHKLKSEQLCRLSKAAW